MGNARGVRRDFVLLRSAASKRLSRLKKALKTARSAVGWRRATRPSADGGKNIRKTARLLCGGRGERDGNPVWMKSTKPVWSSCSCKVPSAWGYETPLWTCPRVAHLIEENFEVDYHPGHVWRILRQLNWSVQQPVGRALERNEDLIDEWKCKRWPEIKKKPRTRAGRLSSSTKVV